MKAKLLFILPLLCLLIGCSDSESENATLDISQTSFDDISSEGETITINIRSNATWSISSNNQWCTPEVTTGENNDKIKIKIDKNNEGYARAATITVTVDALQEKVVFVQGGKQFSTEELTSHHYQLPVIFHILYKDKNNTNQYIRSSRINDIIVACNKYYQNRLNNNSVNMNLDFVPATKDPEGNAMEEPGIDRILVNESTLNCEKFMEDEKNLHYLWDPNRYINILLYTFDNEYILGISHIPYTVAPDKFAGLNQLSFLPKQSDLTYPHCVSINNTYINEESTIEGQFYNSQDVVATIAHELGHYLGLMHAFNEKNNNGNIDTDICEDTDYCDDTPPYNRSDYEKYIKNYIPLDGVSLSFQDLPFLMKRKNCIDNTISTPNNIMDYEISYVNRFTNDQKDRIRYVLAHSPFIPGPKVARNITRATSSPHEFPMRTIK